MLAPFRRSERGTAAIEFAIVVPVLILLFGGIVEIGRAFHVYNNVNRLAAQYAIAWSDCSDVPAGTCSTELQSYSSANTIRNIVPAIKPASLTLLMFQVQMTGVVPTVVYAHPTGATLNAVELNAAQSTFKAGQSGIIVTARYTHQLEYFSAVMTPILQDALTLTYTVAQLKS